MPRTTVGVLYSGATTCSDVWPVPATDMGLHPGIPARRTLQPVRSRVPVTCSTLSSRPQVRRNEAPVGKVVLSAKLCLAQAGETYGLF